MHGAIYMFVNFQMSSQSNQFYNREKKGLKFVDFNIIIDISELNLKNINITSIILLELNFDVW